VLLTQRGARVLAFLHMNDEGATREFSPERAVGPLNLAQLEWERTSLIIMLPVGLLLTSLGGWGASLDQFW
jgi:hypothetical protein